jgi:hypothetical protein
MLSGGRACLYELALVATQREMPYKFRSPFAKIWAYRVSNDLEKTRHETKSAQVFCKSSSVPLYRNILGTQGDCHIITKESGIAFCGIALPRGEASSRRGRVLSVSVFPFEIPVFHLWAVSTADLFKGLQRSTTHRYEE